MFVPSNFRPGMIVVLATHDATTVRECVPCDAAGTLRGLYTLVEHAARQRLKQHSLSVILAADGETLPADDTPASTLVSTIVHCNLISRPRLLVCEPLCGPDHGGTHVIIHGESLSTCSSARVRFGAAVVPCVQDRQQDGAVVLRCQAPKHELGIVRVTLLRCEDDAPSEGDDDDDRATFEFVRLEAAYDAIFATTNSFCPIRSRDDSDAAGCAGGRGDTHEQHQNR